MANRYWRGGTGTWDSSTTTNWSATSGGAGGASVPTSADDVFFDLNSFTAGGQTVTIQASVNCRNLSIQGVTNSPTFVMNGSDFLNVYGDITVTSGPTFSITGSSTELDLEGGTTQTLDTNGVDLGFTLNIGNGTTVELASDLHVGEIINVPGSHTFNSNGYNVTADLISIVDNNTTYNLANSYITVGDILIECDQADIDLTGVTIEFDTTAEFNNLTIPHLVIKPTPSNTVLLGDNSTYTDVDIVGPTGSTGTLDISTTNSYFVDVNVTNRTQVDIISSSNGFKSYTMIYSSTVNSLTVSLDTQIGNLYFSGAVDMIIASGATLSLEGLSRLDSDTSVVELYSATPSEKGYIYIPKQTLSVDYFDITDIQVDGEGLFYAGDNSTNGGGNAGIVFSAPQSFEGQKRVSVVIEGESGTIRTFSDDMIHDYSITNVAGGLPLPVTLTFRRDLLNTDLEESFKLNSRTKIYISDRDNPDRLILYTGTIDTFEVDYDTGQVLLTIFNNAKQLGEHIYKSSDALDDSNTSGATAVVFVVKKYDEADQTALIFSITTQGSTTDITSIDLAVKTTYADIVDPVNSRLSIYSSLADAQNLASDNSIGSTDREFFLNQVGYLTWKFSEPVTVTPLTTYYVRLEVTEVSGTEINVYSENGGTSYYGDGSFSSYSYTPFYRVRRSDNSTTVTHTATEVASVIKDILDRHQELGGGVSYSALSIQPTGSTMTYTFNSNTCLEAIDKCFDFLPSNYTYFIDPATSIFYLKQVNEEADHMLHRGHSVSSLRIRNTIEDIKTRAYFTGGDTGSGILYKRYTDLAGVQQYGVREERIVDGRVTVEATADDIISRRFDIKTIPEVRMEVEVPDNTVREGYNIEIIAPGDTVRVHGYDDGEVPRIDYFTLDEDYLDYNLYKPGSLISRADRVTLTPSKASLFLDSQPTFINKSLEQVRNDLIKDQTLDNPSTPIT